MLLTRQSSPSSAPVSPQPPPAPGSEQPSKPVTRVLILGDSLAVGLGPTLKTLASQSGAQYAEVDAKVGTRIDQWSPKIADLLQQHRPDLVLVSLGTNDAAMFDPTVNAAKAQQIVDAVKNYGARLLWIGLPTLPARLKADTVRQMIQATGVRYFDSRQVSFERAQDGIHATPNGYATWANAIWPVALTS